MRNPFSRLTRPPRHDAPDARGAEPAAPGPARGASPSAEQAPPPAHAPTTAPAPARERESGDERESGQEREADRTARRASSAGRRRSDFRGVPGRELARMLAGDVWRSCVEHRIMGMAAEAAFFTMLSLPALLLGLLGLLGAVDSVGGTDVLGSVRTELLDASGRLLSERGVRQLVAPLLDDLVSGARPGLLSFGFAFALWSGSRAVNVFVGTITVMYGLGGLRNPAVTRLLSFALYVVGLVVGAIAVPMTLLGPSVVAGWWPQLSDVVWALYWPLVMLLAVAFLATLYHVSVPVRSPWRADLPGALVALLLWVLCAVGLRVYLSSAVEGGSIYGSLAAPIAVLLWLGMSAFAVLVGAAVNTAVERVWPTAEVTAARTRALARNPDEARDATAGSRPGSVASWLPTAAARATERARRKLRASFGRRGAGRND